MKLSRLLILAATLLRGLAALGAEAEKSGRVGAAYDSYYLVKHRPGHQFALCTTRGKILTQEYDYLEAIGKDIGKGTGLWWAMPNGDGSLTQILRDDGTPYVKEQFLSSASFFRNEKGVAVLDSGEMLVPGLGDSGQYFRRLCPKAGEGCFANIGDKAVHDDPELQRQGFALRHFSAQGGARLRI